MPIFSWRDYYREVMRETDEETLTELLLSTERAMILRLQELGDSKGHREERIEMKRAAADLLAIKTHKLGWPPAE